MKAINNITQASETPQISTETSETVNVSAEDEKKAERGMYWRILQTRSAGVKRLLADLTEFQNISRI